MDYGVVRAVQGDLIISPSLPRAVVQYGPDFIYLGDLQYIARETHHVEEFIFLSPNSQGHAVRLLLVHFEGFLENKEGNYEFLPQPVVQLGGEEFQYERYLINLQDDFARFPGSDMAHAASYIRQRAYTLAGDMSVQRFSRFVTPNRRNFFSITFIEENWERVLTPDTIQQPDAALHLLERATRSFIFLPEA